MKTKIITLFTLLIVSLSQVMGQTKITPVPPAPGARLIFSENFDSYSTDQSKQISINPFPAGFTGLGFNSDFNSGDPQNNHYVLAKSSYGSPYQVWWGSAFFHTGGATGHPLKPFFDHTYDHTGQIFPTPANTTNAAIAANQFNNLNWSSVPGYMLVVNAYSGGGVFFKYTVPDLCPSTHLIFRVWVGNLVVGGTGRARPKIQFDVYTDATKTTLLGSTKNLSAAVYDPFVNETSAPTWSPKSFEFTTDATHTSVYLEITDQQTDTNGNDLVMDDIEVWLAPPIAAIISPNAHCPGVVENLQAAYDPVKVKQTFPDCEIQWLYSKTNDPDINNWTVLTNGKLDLIDGMTDANLTCIPADASIGGPTGYYRTVIGDMPNSSVIQSDYKCEGMSPPFLYTMAPVDATLFWNLNPTDQNWNNPANWLDDTGAAVNYAPSRCTDVHIPGNAPFYPSLDIATSGYHSSCRNIWFHFGGQIGKPHLLEYDSAYVQYNFGHSTLGNQDFGYGYKGGDNTPFLAGKLYSAPQMERGRWYALAAPLQKISSGDFAVGGYPKTWQQRFESTPQVDGIYGTKASTAHWYSPENIDDWDIGQQYNAIAIWAGEFTATARPGNSPLQALGEGPNFQKYFDTLKGIIEMPYFENDREKANHYMFEHTGGISYFPYFYNKLNSTGDNFLPIPNDRGQMSRGDEAYKFIIEGPAFTRSVNANGDHLYTMTVPTGNEIMVGNPFFSQLDFNAFALSNGITQYRLYEGTAFMPYSTTAGGGAADIGGADQFIAPLQAFFIVPKNPSLIFNADSIAMADPNGNKLRSVSTSAGNMKSDVLYFRAESQVGRSWLTLSMQEVNDENLILLLPDSLKVPQIYATDASGQRNSIQFEGGYVTCVPLGVLSTDSAVVTLTVQNVDNLAVESLVLWDKYLDKKVDLKTTDTYTFKNVPSVSDRFELIAGNKVITGMPVPEVAGTIRANITGNTLYVTAVSGISEVSVISLEGITLSKVTGIGQNTYTQALSIPAGAYLVSVKTSNGETKVVKVVNK